MNFALSDEALEYRDRCRRFAREVIRPVAAKHDAEESASRARQTLTSHRAGVVSGICASLTLRPETVPCRLHPR
jgi:hypothetical protein